MTLPEFFDFISGSAVNCLLVKEDQEGIRPPYTFYNSDVRGVLTTDEPDQ